MSTGSKDRNDLTTGSVWKKLLIFFLPIAAGTMIQQMYNAVDGLIVGRYVGTGALAAVAPLENCCVVSELLCTGADPARVIAGIAGLCPAERYEVRTPVFFPGPGEVRPFVYCHDPAGALSVPASFWYAFGLE